MAGPAPTRRSSARSSSARYVEKDGEQAGSYAPRHARDREARRRQFRPCRHRVHPKARGGPRRRRRGTREAARRASAVSRPACRRRLRNAVEQKGKWWPDPVEIGENCPESGDPLVRRWGRNGPFIGCTKYPDCQIHTQHSAQTARSKNPNSPSSRRIRLQRMWRQDDQALGT